MAINNIKVVTGDYLFDILNGRGKVVATDHNLLEVEFDNGRRMSFDKAGYLNGQRRLFWQQPVIIDPPKDAQLWEHIKKLLTAVMTYTRSVG